MTRGLTARQREVLACITHHMRQRNCPPTIRELASELGISSTNGVRDHLRALMEKGFIRRSPRLARGIELTGDWHSIVSVDDAFRSSHPVALPVVGQVAAGVPILAQQNIEDTITLDERYVRGAQFALRVRGDSMRDAGILENDFVLVHQQAVAERGDIVVALLGDEATVKRFYHEDGAVRLQAENPAFGPIHIPPGDPSFRLVGVVRGVFRVL
jgi:repressor LexA